MTNHPNDEEALRVIRRLLSAAAAEARLDRVITDEDCQQVLQMQHDEGKTNAEIIAQAEYLMENQESILDYEENLT